MPLYEDDTRRINSTFSKNAIKNKKVLQNIFDCAVQCCAVHVAQRSIYRKQQQKQTMAYFVVNSSSCNPSSFNYHTEGLK